MSPKPDPSSEIQDEDGEVLDALPVLAEAPRVVAAQPRGGLPAQRRPTVLPVVQAAAVAAGGFVAGAAVVGLVNRHNRRSRALERGRRGAGRLRRGGRGGVPAQVVGSRSFLVDVHLLGGAGGDR